jgi:hypothetical protein
VDDLVEHDSHYKQMVDTIIQRYNCTPPCCDGTCDLRKPSEELINSFKSAYFQVRNVPGCSDNKEGLNLDQVNDKHLVQALKNKENVVVETTGSYIPSWVLDMDYVEGYNVVFAYTLVAFPILMERTAKRNQKEMTKYIKHEQDTAPRVVDNRKHVFGPIVDKIYETLLKLRNKCLEGKCQDGNCHSEGGRSVDSKSVFDLLIYDNNAAKMRLIYDHRLQSDMSEKDFEKFIHAAFYDAPPSSEKA